MPALQDHIRRDSGSVKTVCVCEVLTNLGIPLNSFYSTSTPKNTYNYESIIRRNGFALRSRKSSIPNGATVGGIRKKLQTFCDPQNSLYLILVPGHLILLDKTGKTVVDTAPRKRDRRKVQRIHAIFNK